MFETFVLYYSKNLLCGFCTNTRRIVDYVQPRRRASAPFMEAWCLARPIFVIEVSQGGLTIVAKARLKFRNIGLTKQGGMVQDERLAESGTWKFDVKFAGC